MNSRLVIKSCVALMFGLISSGYAVGEEINFYCKGIAKGRPIADSPSEFNLTVQTSPPELWMPAYITGCVNMNNDKNFQGKCEISSTEVTCSCSGGGLVSYSRYSLSRLSGLLQTWKEYADKKSKGEVKGRYECKRIEKKVF